MKILDNGHRYLIDTLDNKDNEQDQIIQFVKRSGDNFPFNYGVSSGTNCQEVLRVLIDRTEYLQSQKPCAETESIIGCLRTALLLFELRAARHHNRFLALRDTQELMHGPTCKICGHIGCQGHKE